MLGRPLATAPLATLPPDLVVGTQTVTVRYASESFITRSTDNPADTLIAGRIASGLEIGRELTRAADGQFGSLIEARFGEIALNNDDRALDPLINDYYADGREVRLKIGAKEIQAADRIMPRWIATGGGTSSADASAPYVLTYPPGVLPNDLLIAQLTINDRGSGGIILTPARGILSVTGFVPTVTGVVSTTRTPASGILSVTGFAPIVTVAIAAVEFGGVPVEFGGVPVEY